jgi:hypothetical protein
MHPYLFMIFALYVVWAMLIIVQAFIYPNEYAHLWTDIPALFVFAAACLYWHPHRLIARSKEQ